MEVEWFTSPLEGEVETAGDQPGVEGGGDMEISPEPGGRWTRGTASGY